MRGDGGDFTGVSAFGSTTGTFSGTNSIDYTHLMGNLWYDFAQSGGGNLYVGGGIGAAYLNVNLSGNTPVSENYWRPAGQIGFGGILKIDETQSLDIGYRMKPLPSGSVGLAGSTAEIGSYINHSMVVGYQRKF